MIPLGRVAPARASIVLTSPNQGPRPSGVTAIECVVLHATADGGNEAGAERWMCSPDALASAHLHIRRDGTVVRLVPDLRRAWHAGRSVWLGRADVNAFSLGWEIANRNDGVEKYTDAQYAAVARLAAHYVGQGLPFACFVSHAEVARPHGRKTDPAGFSWERLRADVREIAGASSGVHDTGDTDAMVSNCAEPDQTE